MAALLIAVTLWLILVPGSVVGKMTYEIPIEIQNIPEGFELVEVVPSSVFVTLSGERRHLFQSKSRQLGVRLDGTLTRFGRQTFPINNTHLLLPPEVEIDAIDPEEVRVLVKAIGIPLTPLKHYFKRQGEYYSYTLVFPALPTNTVSIDIIEKLAPGFFFNFYNIAYSKWMSVPHAADIQRASN